MQNRPPVYPNPRSRFTHACRKLSLLGEAPIDAALTAVRKSGIGHLGNFYWLPTNGAAQTLNGDVHVILVGYRMTAETLARPQPAIPTADVELALRELDQSPNVFRRLGQVWVLKYDGQMVLMEDARGLSYLARLLWEPGRTVPAASLLAAVVGIDPRITTGSLERGLDDEGMANYRERYAELQGGLDEAERFNDLGRIDQLKTELEALELQLAREIGLGGRRREKIDADRVRKNVSMAVTSLEGIHGSSSRTAK